jgi:hypothetical protein
MFDVIRGTNTFSIMSSFSNWEAELKKINNGFKVIINAKHFMEPRSSFAFMLNNSEDEISIHKNGVCMTGHTPDVKLNNGQQGNCWSIMVSEATVPGFPFECEINAKDSAIKIQPVAILYEVNQTEWRTMPLLWRA